MSGKTTDEASFKEASFKMRKVPLTPVMFSIFLQCQCVGRVSLGKKLGMSGRRVKFHHGV